MELNVPKIDAGVHVSRRQAYGYGAGLIAPEPPLVKKLAADAAVAYIAEFAPAAEVSRPLQIEILLSA